MSKAHVLCKCTKKFGISERIQGSICLIGQSISFEEGSKLIEELMGISISAPQIQRVCGYYGKQLDELIEGNCTSIIPQIKSKDKTDHVYVMIDGSMLFTREDKWRELKLGRIFFGNHVIDIQRDRREITESIYVSCLGSVDEFFPKFERFWCHIKIK